MKIAAEPIRTGVYQQGNDLVQFIIDAVGQRPLEGCVLAITSKIVSLHEDRVVSSKTISKRELVKQEADLYLGEGGFGVELTIKHGIMIASAGIDESNSAGGDFILYPEDPYLSAQKLWTALKTQLKFTKFGLILTDSQTLPLRLGVTGIGLSHWGFRATKSFVGRNDLFGRPLKFTNINVIDSLAAIAVFTMGEADEQTPLAVISGVDLEFTSASSAQEVAIAPEDDIYFPLLGAASRDEAE